MSKHKTEEICPQEKWQQHGEASQGDLKKSNIYGGHCTGQSSQYGEAGWEVVGGKVLLKEL